MTAPLSDLHRRNSGAGRPAYLPGGGVLIPAGLADPIWRALRAHLSGLQRDGGRIRPEVAEVVEALRSAAMDHHLASASGPEQRTFADIAAESSSSVVLTTEALAARLGVTARHARRLARAEGIHPIARNCWARDDVAALTGTRRDRR